jgi:NAD(P)H-nitrite reductase large subunit
MRYVIIGNSAAGIGAAEALREADPDSPLTIIADEPEAAYSRALISYELAGWLPPGAKLELRSPRFYEERHIQTLPGRRAERLDTAAKEVVLADGERVPYDRLLLAVGGSPQKSGVPGEDQAGIFGFRTARDLAAIHEAVKTARDAVVLGGGCIGLQAACGLHHHGVRTTIAIASDHLLSQVADPECGDLFQGLFERNGITVLTGAAPAEFTGGERVEGVRFADNRALPAQIVITGKGVAPNVELARGTKIRVEGGLVVDDHMRTAEPDVFAAGDAAVTRDRVTGRSTVNAVWPGAYEQGRVAGFNMAGRDRRYDGSMRQNAAEFFGLPFISLGIVKPKGDGYESHSRLLKEKGIYWKLVFLRSSGSPQGNRLVGVVLAGRVDGAGVLGNLMRRCVDVSCVKDDLLAGRYDFARLLPLIREQAEAFTEAEYGEILEPQIHADGHR